MLHTNLHHHHWLPPIFGLLRQIQLLETFRQLAPPAISFSQNPFQQLIHTDLHVGVSDDQDDKKMKI